MITALLVDDEPKTAKRLASMLSSHPEVEVIGISESVAEAERFLRFRTPDVVFLDMTMPERVGIELLPSIGPRTRVVFVTASEAYAVKAFEHGAVDYVLKPFSAERLAMALDRLRLALSERDRTGPPAPAPGEAAIGSADASGRISLNLGRGRGAELVPLAEIAWIMAAENYTRLQLRGREPVIQRRKMAEWESVLPAPRFVRIDRSLIVQTGLVESLERISAEQTLLRFDGVAETLPIGRTAAARIREALDG